MTHIKDHCCFWAEPTTNTGTSGSLTRGLPLLGNFQGRVSRYYRHSTQDEELSELE